MPSKTAKCVLRIRKDAATEGAITTPQKPRQGSQQEVVRTSDSQPLVVDWNSLLTSKNLPAKSPENCSSPQKVLSGELKQRRRLFSLVNPHAPKENVIPNGSGVAPLPRDGSDELTPAQVACHISVEDVFANHLQTISFGPTVESPGTSPATSRALSPAGSHNTPMNALFLSAGSEEAPPFVGRRELPNLSPHSQQVSSVRRGSSFFLQNSFNRSVFDASVCPKPPHQQLVEKTSIFDPPLSTCTSEEGPAGGCSVHLPPLRKASLPSPLRGKESVPSSGEERQKKGDDLPVAKYCFKQDKNKFFPPTVSRKKKVVDKEEAVDLQKSSPPGGETMKKLSSTLGANAAWKRNKSIRSSTTVMDACSNDKKPIDITKEEEKDQSDDSKDQGNTSQEFASPSALSRTHTPCRLIPPTVSPTQVLEGPLADDEKAPLLPDHDAQEEEICTPSAKTCSQDGSSSSPLLLSPHQENLRRKKSSVRFIGTDDAPENNKVLRRGGSIGGQRRQSSSSQSSLPGENGCDVGASVNSDSLASAGTGTTANTTSASSSVSSSYLPQLNAQTNSFIHFEVQLPQPPAADRNLLTEGNLSRNNGRRSRRSSSTNMSKMSVSKTAGWRSDCGTPLQSVGASSPSTSSVGGPDSPGLLEPKNNRLQRAPRLDQSEITRWNRSH